MDVVASERLSLSERLSTISLRFSTLVCTREEKKVIFIDEIPWLDTPRSGFLSALEYFWIRAAWTGLAFERVCFQHIPQIKQAMGIAGVATQCYSWKAKGDALSSGTQIDMVLDRRDNIINICEMKFSKGEYTITKDYAMALNNKVERFIESTKNKKTILLTMITTNGVVHNEYWNQIQCDITADELFNA